MSENGNTSTPPARDWFAPGSVQRLLMVGVVQQKLTSHGVTVTAEDFQKMCDDDGTKLSQLEQLLKSWGDG